MSRYLSIDDYQDGSLFISTGKKAVYCARHWYVHRVRDDIDSYFSGLGNDLDDQINDELQDRGIDGSADAVHDVLNGGAMDELQSQFSIPLILKDTPLLKLVSRWMGIGW